MDNRLYRKAAIDRLSSPEGLDRLLTVTDRRDWLVLIGVVIFVATALAWSIMTSIPTKAQGEGMLIGQGGVLNVVSIGGGVVSNFRLKTGDKVNAGDIVASVSQPETATSIQQIRNRLLEERNNANRSISVDEESTRLQLATLDRQKVTIEGDIKRTQDMEKLAVEQAEIEQHLLDRGLSTRQQVNLQQQKLVQLRSEEQKARAQLGAIDAQRFALQEEPETRRRDAAGRVAELQRQLDGLQQQMERSTRVISPFSGTVVELKVYEGSNIAAGTPVLSLQPDIMELQVVAFVPSSEAKRILPGMRAEISPTIIKREEHGFVRGHVTYVSDFPTTGAAAMRTFENQSLVNSLMSRGLSNEIRITLDKDEYGGLAWSSKRAPLETINSGTLCKVEVIIRQQKPIELVMPYLKRSLNTD